MIIFDNRPLWERAKEVYQSFSYFHGYWRKAEERGELLDSGLRWIIQRSARELFELPFQVREQMPGLNSKLEEMASSGFLELDEKEILPGDPVTRGLYFENLYSRILSNPENPTIH